MDEPIEVIWIRIGRKSRFESASRGTSRGQGPANPDFGVALVLLS
jgi:hypothetical protein